MPSLKDVPEGACPENRAYCSDFHPSGKKCKYFRICLTHDADMHVADGY